MAQIGLTEASRLTGKATSTIVRAVQAGKLSASKDGNGRAIYDVAELERFFGQLTNPDEKRNAAAAANGHAVQQALQRMSDLRAEGLEREVRRLEAMVEDVKADRDQWRQQATALLTDQRPKEAAPAAAAPAPRGLLARLFWG